jgi:hypothetical protein
MLLVTLFWLMKSFAGDSKGGGFSKKPPLAAGGKIEGALRVSLNRLRRKVRKPVGQRFFVFHFFSWDKSTA